MSGSEPVMLMTTDTRLVARVIEGDRDAFDAVYAASFPSVFSFAARRAGDRGAAEALAERILRRAFGCLDRYDGEVPFAAWLLQQAKQVVREEKPRRRPERARSRPPFAHGVPT
jgi:DNA-directed RNA polymerase specialized sigma24 family protein